MQLSLTPENIRDLINLSGLVIDVAGVMVILTGAVVSTLLYLANVLRGSSSLLVYRKNFGR